MKRKLLLSVAFAAAVAASPATAAIVDVGFSGVFDLYRSGCSSMPGPSSPPCTSSAISSPFTGAFSYSTTPDYTISGGVMSSNAFASVGRPTTITSTGSRGEVALPLPAGTLAYSNIFGSQFFVDIASISMTYPAGIALNPGAPPPFALATSATISFITFGSPGGTGQSLSGYVTSLTAVERSAVPEPSIWLMLAAGIGAVGFALRRSGAHRPERRLALVRMESGYAR